MEKHWKEMDASERCTAIAGAHNETIGTGSAIAAALSRRFSTCISRNSVISFYRRHHEKLSAVPLTGKQAVEIAAVRAEASQPRPTPRPSSVNLEPRPKPRRPSALLAANGMAFAAPKPKPVPPTVVAMEPVPVISAPEPRNLRLYELDSHHCRWPLKGERENMLFCANATHDGTSYCHFHKMASVGIGSKAERTAVPRRLMA